jgi:hypothetical protein
MSQTAELLINPDEVEAVFRDCLFREEELKGVNGAPEGAVIVQGITAKLGFHPERLEEKRDLVKTWLAALPREFRKNEGGGWSFLKACEQSNGVQWTGLHQRMEQLFTLALGLGLAEYNAGREFWANLPGDMPYITINIG